MLRVPFGIQPKSNELETEVPFIREGIFRDADISVLIKPSEDCSMFDFFNRLMIIFDNETSTTVVYIKSTGQISQHHIQIITIINIYMNGEPHSNHLLT